MTLDDIKDALSNLVNLDVRTIVGDFDHDDDGIRAKGDAKSIVTRINLLGGDITTAFSSEFLDSPLDEVRDFHSMREAHALEIVQGNIQALQQLVTLIGTIQQEESQMAILAAKDNKESYGDL
jgi:hypothetical protein